MEKASYNATKAALHHWGNTLRVEMKPFEYVDRTWCDIHR
jgi:short-subunit dehydrogenase involved in D-alanine esterification of teichoic acids